MPKRFICLFLILGFASGSYAQTKPPGAALPETNAAVHSNAILPFDTVKTKQSQGQPLSDTSQADSSADIADQIWRPILLLHTLPKEPGSDIFQWTWNPAAIETGFLAFSTIVYEDYNLKHSIPQGGIARQFAVSNRIYQAAVFWGLNGLQLGFAVGRRYKSTREKIEYIPQNSLNGQPPQSFDEVSTVFSPTAGYRFSFGLSFALRANFRNVRFTNRTPGSYSRTTNHITTLDFGLEQNLGNRIFINLFSNEVMEFINGDELNVDNAPKYINLSGTIKWHNAWGTGGFRLTRSGSAKDSLLFLQVSFQAAAKFWLTAFYTQSLHYQIIDMDANIAAPVVLVGGGLYYHWGKWLFNYQLSYLRFSRVTENFFADANFLDRNHLRHEFSILLVL